MLCDNQTVQATIDKYVPFAARRFMEAQRIRVVALKASERYNDMSAALRRLGVDVDGWPVPPAGLFVVEERTVYLRSRSPMSVIHELGHALDCALGDGIYHTAYSKRVREYYREAKAFVTPYAATGIDEYFAEAFRAMCGANATDSFWPKVTPERLERIDPKMYHYMKHVLTNAAAEAAEGEGVA